LTHFEFKSWTCDDAPMPIIGLNHVALQVKDVEKTVAFYTQVVGLTLLPRPNFGFPGAWLRIGKEPYELHLIQSPAGGEVASSGSRGNHFAMQVTGLDDYPAKLAGKTAWTKGPVLRPDGARQFFFQDPDGHTVELVEFA
jgi:catechol 2,3-dioxygenase-like lactoylglutathione lyase family enzyme